jgi:integrase-like protein
VQAGTNVKDDAAPLRIGRARVVVVHINKLRGTADVARSGRRSSGSSGIAFRLVARELPCKTTKRVESVEPKWVERLHQTLKRYLGKQRPAETLQGLQSQLDAFVHYYNDIRPHRALHGRTPLQAYSARVKAKPAAVKPETHFRVREDRVDAHGKVSLRYMSRLYKIGLGRAHKGRPVKLLIADQQIRVIDLDGQLIRELTLDPSRKYQPLGQT